MSNENELKKMAEKNLNKYFKTMQVCFSLIKKETITSAEILNIHRSLLSYTIEDIDALETFFKENPNDGRI
ncbi:MAG: hypothetical protein HQK51_19705 [Oligoflexia bacterium]|nr:hypothetical protein [Oligoflexia bacterium]